MYKSLLFVILFTLSRAENQQVNKLLDDYFEWKIDTFKVNLYAKGYNKHAGEIDDYDEEKFHQIGRKCEHFHDRADELLRQIGDQLEVRDRRYVKVLRKECGFCVRGMEAEGFFFPPVEFMSGLQTFWPNFFKNPTNFKLDTNEDYNNVLAMLQKIPKQVDQVQILCEKAISRKLTFHEASMSRTKKQFENLFTDFPEDSNFYIPFQNASKDVQEKAKDTIQNEVFLAFRKLEKFVLNEYMMHTRKWPGLASLQNGEKRYQRYLEYQTTIEGITPEEVHNIGLDEVKRLQKLAVKIAEEEMGIPNATFKKVATILKEDPKQEFFSEAEVLSYFIDINDRVKPKLKNVMDKALLNEDTYNIIVKPVPPGGGGLAYYNGPTVDGRRKGTFYVNVNNLKNIKKFETYSLTLHEGNPGHHLQFAFIKCSPIPKFLKSNTFSWANPGVPLRYTSHTEGWGLYAEYLGHEMGMYDDPEQAIGFYSWNLLRACRLVVDTGLHMFGWSRQRAIDYLAENTAMSLSAIEGQIDRYITWPAQATAYKIGEIKIREIRKRREKELDSNFDLGAFHRHVLTCIGPIDMLEECILEEEQLPFESNSSTTFVYVPLKSARKPSSASSLNSLNSLFCLIILIAIIE